MLVIGVVSFAVLLGLLVFDVVLKSPFNMKINVILKIMAVIPLMALLSVGNTSADQTPMLQNYAVIDLGTLGSGNQSYAYGINNDGTVVGSSHIDSSYTQHAFKYANNHMTDIALVTDGIVFSQANGINNSGQIVGYGSVPSDNNLQHALRYSNGIVQDLTPGLHYNCSATGINSLGQVVGYGSPQIVEDIRYSPNDITFNQSVDGFLITSGVMKDLGTIDGFKSSQAYAVNDNGQAVGYSQNSQFAQHAFVYSNSGPMNDLDNALGANGYSVAYGINNNGQIVGVAYNAFVYDMTTSQTTDLGALDDPYNNYSTGLGISSSRTAVGTVYIGSLGVNHAFVYPLGGPMKDLNDLIDPASNWTLESATAINDAGQIVGYGINPDGNEHAFLLNPFITPTYTGFHQFDSVASGVPSEFGNADPIQYAQDGTAHGSDGRAITKDYGCALCSLASMLTSVPGFESVTPTQLNADLIANNGYESGCIMYWPAIYTITHGALKRADSEAISASSADHSALDKYLNDHCWGNRYRVILELEANGDKKQTHYIFVVGKTNNDWVVFDPGWDNAFDLNTSNLDSRLLGLLSGHFTGFKANSGVNRVFTVTGVEAYLLNPPSNGSLNEVVHSPVELLVTDPNGNRVGYDPIAGADVFEIAGASYSRDYPILDADTDGGGSAGDTNGIKIVSIPAPLGGSYSTALIGTGSGSYTFDSSLVWFGNSETDQTTTGTTDVGVITTCSVFVITPPIITSSSVTSGMFNLSFTAQTNISYAVQEVNSLLSTNWTSLTTVTATSTNTTASVPMSDPNMMFYRVVSQ